MLWGVANLQTGNYIWDGHPSPRALWASESREEAEQYAATSRLARSFPDIVYVAVPLVGHEVKQERWGNKPVPAEILAAVGFEEPED